ncbi:uncharacterized protein JCM15063_002041 [Sporobolomyces koalae]|uniref:uncharacterized protein n=1 Tax=Sporobolomyces koalae TaxID=500713 RepID=UPI00316D883D
MGWSNRIVLVVLPIASISLALLQPRLSVFGIWRRPSPALHLESCRPVTAHGLEACEDAWIDHSLGLAYLACSTQETRSRWSPSLGLLDADHLTASSIDTLRLYSFATGESSILELDGLPYEARGGIWTHGIEAFPHGDGETLTLFVVSHRPRQDAQTQGADSVVELFETRRGTSKARWIRTVQHALVVTPNNLVATGPRSFYVSNDHRHKTHWTRKFEMVYSPPSSVVHCDASDQHVEPECIVAIDDVVYPNGLARFPNSSTLYIASTMTGEITTYEIQADYTLFPLPAKISLDRPIDNIHVSPSTSTLYASTFPRMLKFMGAAQTGGLSHSRMHDNPVEIWKIEPETGDQRFYGHQYKTSLVLSDPENEILSSITTAAPYGNQLLLTGHFTKNVVVCEMSDNL